MYRCTPPLWPYNCMTGTRIYWFNSGWLGICGGGAVNFDLLFNESYVRPMYQIRIVENEFENASFLFQLFETFYYIDFDSKNNCFSRISAPFVKVNSTYMKHKV